MAKVFRLKQNFSSGELSPLMDARTDFKRYISGCNILRNMKGTTQGPAERRSGTKYIYDLNTLGLDTANPKVRNIPFVFNELQAYIMVFFMHTDGSPRLVFATNDGLVTYSDPPPVLCPPVPIQTWPVTQVDDDYNLNYTISVDTDIQVVYTDINDVDEILVLNTDYSVVINDPLPNVITLISRPETDGTLKAFLYGKGVAGDIVTLILPPTWDIELFDWAQSADEMYISQPKLQPHVIKRFGSECWELVVKTFTDQPIDWSDAAGWPERVTFHQQRLVFAANTLRRQTVWMSKAGDFNDFGQESSIVDSDAVTFTLDSGTQNKIQWMISGKTLNIGTLANEWIVSGATRNAITPSNVLAQRQTNHGSEPTTPIMVGITILFIERHGRVVNEFVYNLNVDSYETSDMAILSNHITEIFSLTDWAYQQTPDSVVWCIREDGTLVGITYQRQHQVIGWHRHDTKGEFKTISVIPGSNREDEVWFIIKRVILGQDKYYIERMEESFKSEDTTTGRFLDSGISYTGVPVSTVSGLDHLEGETVDLMVDGAAHPERVVINGTVTLNGFYSDVLVGLAFKSEIWPTIPDVKSSDGSVLGRMQRITDVDIDLYKTLGMTIGRRDSEDGIVEEEVPFRIPGDLTGQKVPLFTGIAHIEFPEGFDRVPNYFISQEQPFPLTVRAVMDTFEYED